MSMARLHLAHERFHNLDAKAKANPFSLEEVNSNQSINKKISSNIT